MIKVGLVQTNIRPHAVVDNFHHYEELIARQLKVPVQLLVFPEMFTSGFEEDMMTTAKAMNGPSMEFLSQMARRLQCEVVATLPIVERGRLYNRLVWMSPTGMLGTYDKHHLFFGEEMFTAGSERTIIETLGGRFLPLICFDVRFPEWSRNRVRDHQYEYDCLIYATNFPIPREEVLLKLAAARAIENQAYTLVVNRVGSDGRGTEYRGGTAVFSPEGDLLAAAKLDREEIVMATLDFEALAQLRRDFPVAQQWPRF